MNQNSIREYIIPSEFLQKRVNLQFEFHLKLIHLSIRFLLHSDTKMKGLDNFLYLMLLYFSNCIYE